MSFSSRPVIYIFTTHKIIAHGIVYSFVAKSTSTELLRDLFY